MCADRIFRRTWHRVARLTRCLPARRAFGCFVVLVLDMSGILPWLRRQTAPSPPKPRNGHAAGGVGSRTRRYRLVEQPHYRSFTVRMPVLFRIILLLVTGPTDHEMIVPRRLHEGLNVYLGIQLLRRFVSLAKRLWVTNWVTIALLLSRRIFQRGTVGAWRNENPVEVAKFRAASAPPAGTNLAA